ncbi:dystrotelin [Thalassophryne amazonica]|uniref:dystrotelin n=1 Tax=Thalassophryne amazonica TaxID=390379 RepID=UPI0014723A3A|nr:dystrotelin [Thalassophryne amazonica]
MKLLSMQKRCRLNVVTIRHITAALQPLLGTQKQKDVLSRENVLQTLNRMFYSVSQEVPGHVTLAAPDETCDLIYNLYDRDGTGGVSVACLHTVLTALSADSPSDKYTVLVGIAETVSGSVSGSVSRDGLRSLLRDLSQVPAAVQEEAVFGDVETAVCSCFHTVLTSTVRGDVVLSWLQSEPQLLLWLPVLSRVSASQNVTHAVRCHVCKTFPITGLRYRCLKCVNLHVCQNCFLTDRRTKKHKTHHPVLEFCTQPTWKESLSTLVHSARHALLPRRYTSHEADRRRGLMRTERVETQKEVPPYSHSATQLTASAVHHTRSASLASRREREDSPNTSQQGLSRPLASKCLQTDSGTPQVTSLCFVVFNICLFVCVVDQDSALLTEVQNLHRDKWLMERQLQAWRLTVQSDHSILEDRCAEMEATMETLRQHNLRLQSRLTQALKQMDTQQHHDTLTSDHKEHEGSTHTLTSDHKEPEGSTHTLTSDHKEPEGSTHTLTSDLKEHEGSTYTSGTEEGRVKNTEEEEEVILKSSCEEKEEDDEDASPSLLRNAVKEQPDTKTPSPITHQDTHQSGCCQEKDPAGDRHISHPMTQRETAWQCKSEGVWPQESHVHEEEEEDCGTCSPEELLQESSERLKLSMTLRTDAQMGNRMKAELLKAAHTVGDSIRHLVDTVRTHTNHVTL